MDIPEFPEQAETAPLRATLDGRWADLRNRVREQLGALPHLGSQQTDLHQRRAQVYEQLEYLARSGAPQIGFPESCGGEGDVGGAVIAIETLGMADLSAMVKAGVQWGLFGGAVELLGTERHHRSYLPSIMDLRLLGCFAMTETGHGSDVQRLRTTATFDVGSGEFVINTPDEAARKDYIGNAAVHGRMAVVFAQLITGGTSRGVHAWLVPIRDEHGAPAPGVTIGDCGHKEGLEGVDNGRLWFDHVRVPRETLLNHFGEVAEDGTYSSPIEHDNARFFTMLGTLIRGRVSVAGAAGAASKTALTIAMRYANVRKQFLAPDGREVALLDYLAHQRKLLPALARSYALHFAQEELVAALHRVQTGEQPEQHDRREVESRAAGLKAITTWHASQTVQTCREACGGAGYLSENQLPRWQADIDVFTTFEGDNTVMLQLVAKGLLTGYRDELHELGSLETARLVANYAGQAIIERTAAGPMIERLIAAVQHGSTSMFDRGWQLQLFEDRETHVLQTCARRLQRAESSEQDAFAVFNDAQDHVLRLARVHIERIVLEANIAALERCIDERARQLLERVCDLYVFSSIEADLGWFLGHNRLDNARGKQITGVVNTLCQRLRPHAETLVDALGVPESCVLAPIATGAETRRQAEATEPP